MRALRTPVESGFVCRMGPAASSIPALVPHIGKQTITSVQLYNSIGIRYCFATPGHDTSGKNCITVYALVCDGATYTQGSKISVGVPATADGFGDRASNGGSTVVIGSPFVDGARGVDVDAAYVFVPQDKDASDKCG